MDDRGFLLKISLLYLYYAWMNYSPERQKLYVMRFLRGIFFIGFLLPRVASAEGFAKNWQLGFSEPASPLARRIFGFHDDILLPLTFTICVLVFALGFFICWRFSEKRNKVPSKRTHNSKLEIVWTLIPVVILALISVPSFKLMHAIDDLSDTSFTIKATGHQWYWSYEYPDHEGLTFDSNLVRGDDLRDKSKRLLQTDNALVIPVDQKLRLLITSADVLHSWSVPRLGVKMDAVTGKVNEIWLQADKMGTYYGFCTELCGDGHAYMPVEVRVVSRGEFALWLRDAKKRFAFSSERRNDLSFALRL